MNDVEAGMLLLYLAELDGRRFTTVTADAWADVLSPYSFEDCKRAVVELNRESVDFVKPAHIALKAKRFQQERIREAGLTGDFALTRVDADASDSGASARRALRDAARRNRLSRREYLAYLQSGEPFGAVRKSLESRT